jgi:ABC-type Na+ efflux pump permease subunit
MDPLNTGFSSNYKPMKIGDWLITFLIQAIPLVGFVMLFVWAFGDGTHPSKKSWAQASLIFALIILVLVIILFAALWTLIGSFFAHNYNIHSV